MMSRQDVLPFSHYISDLFYCIGCILCQAGGARKNLLLKITSLFSCEMLEFISIHVIVFISMRQIKTIQSHILNSFNHRTLSGQRDKYTHNVKIIENPSIYLLQLYGHWLISNRKCGDSKENEMSVSKCYPSKRLSMNKKTTKPQNSVIV